MYTTQPTLLSRLRDMEDQSAWREFDDRYRELILRYCRRKGLQPADAEDVRQMVMLNLARQLGSFRYRPELGRFRGYLGRTVGNAIHRYFRRPRRELLGLDLDGAAADDRQEDPEWEAEWMSHHYRLAMDTVRKSAQPRSVEVFEHLLAGGCPEEAARRFSLSKAAVHKVKQRMRDRLKQLIARQIWEEDGLDADPRA